MNAATKRVQTTFTIEDTIPKAIPQSPKDQSPFSSVGVAPFPAPDEAVRIATKLRAQLTKHDRVILFAGIHERAGVAELASHVALTLSLLEKESVLLLDADVSRPSLHDRYNIPLSPGLSDAIAEGLSMLEIVQPTSVGQLYMVSAGAMRREARSLFTSTRFQPLMEALRNKFRFVVANVAPVMAEVTTSLICTAADGIVLATPVGRERRSDLLAVRDELKSLKTRVLGTVLFEQQRNDPPLR